MKWLTDTIAGRTILVLIFGLGTILALAQHLYQKGIEREAAHYDVERLVDRLILLSNTITALEPSQRDEAAHKLSGGPLELHWARQPLTIAGGAIDSETAALRDELVARLPKLAKGGLVVGTNRIGPIVHGAPRDADEPHTTLLSMALPDASWLNVSLVTVQSARAAPASLLISAALGALAIAVLSVLMSRWLTRPLERLADGADRMFKTSETAPLPESGTREVRTLAAAINGLQHRIGRMVKDRTQTLAAVSHDLRTPLTRLRLRSARVEDAATRRAIESDLDEMEAMIDAALEFFRSDVDSEEVAQVDLAAILQTIADDAADAGQNVEVTTPAAIVVRGRHLALKRALTNLVQNAVRYGGAARITASRDGARVLIVVVDDGPGIPPGELDAVFEPFYRVEGSRGRDTGGHGLGLTVARSIARAHGGDVTLANRPPHGLAATMTLPV